MSEYILDPGARLEIGPGGKPYEELGACCRKCAQSGLGADKSSVLTGAGAGAGTVYTTSGGAPGTGVQTAPASGSSALPMILSLGAVGVVGFFIVRRLRRRRR